MSMMLRTLAKEGQTRRKWGGGETRLKVQPVEPPPGEINEAYEEYLILLQERNKLIKNLKKKDDRTIELERKEQGFSLYLNGANQNIKPGKHHSPKTARPKSRKTKTAGSRGIHSESDPPEESLSDRAKTAPEKNRRKNWLAGSVNIKTARGEKVKVKAPEILTGRYDDDFELDASDKYASESESESQSYSESSSESEEDSVSEAESVSEEELYQQENQLIKRHYSYSDHSESDEPQIKFSPQRKNPSTKGKKEGLSRKVPIKDRGDGPEMSEQVTLSLADVKKLRQSLEMNASFRQSLARQISTSDSESEREADIIEEDEIEEDLGRVSSPGEGDSKPQLSPSKLKPTDMVVLEFASQPKKTKEGGTLSAARRKDTDSLGQLKGSKATKLTSSSSSSPSSSSSRKGDKNRFSSKPPKELMLKPESPSHRKQRPLSASRKSADDKQDTNTEAQAVIQAMKAENESLEKRKRDTRSAPGRPEHDDGSPLPQGEEAGGRPSSVSSSWKDRLKATSTTGQPSRTSKEGWGGDEDGSINQIVQKVLQLDLKGQRRLMKALAHIEDSSGVSPEKLASALSGGHASKPAVKKQPMKAMVPVKHMIKAHSGGEYEIKLQILSNWGHTKRVGLTEIQVFDQNNKKIDINPDDVGFHGASSTKGEKSALLNGKFKTTKDRHMWSCDWNGRTLDIIIHCGHPQLQISKIKIWNYNKSLTELSIGVRDMMIMINGQEVFEGEIDKGCGNQVFDYGKTIILTQEDTSSADNSPQRAPPPSHNGQQSSGVSPRLDAYTPAIDNVSFHSEESEEELDPLQLSSSSVKENKIRSETRCTNRETNSSLELPVVESVNLKDKHKEKPIKHKPKKSPTVETVDRESAKPKESQGQPKNKKGKKSMMAARLDRSKESVSTSATEHAAYSMENGLSLSYQSTARSMPDSNVDHRPPSRRGSLQSCRSTEDSRTSKSRDKGMPPSLRARSESPVNSHSRKEEYRTSRSQDKCVPASPRGRSQSPRVVRREKIESAREDSVPQSPRLRRRNSNGSQSQERHRSSSRSREGNLSARSREGNLSARSREGHSSARSREGHLSARSQEGNLSARSREGNLSARSREGNLSARSREGNLSARSREGNLSARSREGNLSARSQDGSSSVRLREVNLSGRSQEGNLSAKSHDGTGKSQNGYPSFKSRDHTLPLSPTFVMSAPTFFEKSNHNKTKIKNSDAKNIQMNEEDEKRKSKKKLKNQERTDQGDEKKRKSKDIPKTNKSVTDSNNNHKAKGLLAPHIKDVNKPKSPYYSDDDTPMLQRLRNITTNDSVPGKPSWLQSRPDSSCSLGSKPTWLKEESDEPFQSPPISRGGSQAGSRPSSGRSSRQDSDIIENWPKAGIDHLATVLDEKKLLDLPPQGRRSRRANTPEKVADEEEEEKYRQQVIKDSPEHEKAEDVPRMKRIESARAQWRQKEQNKLEESWSSLSMFDRSQKGRISLDMERDVMDEYLNVERNKPTEPTITEEPQDVDDDDDFMIPELPQGQELVISIKTTWGDKHYVGLNGIEIHTSTGHPAPISKIHADPSDINILPEYNKDPRVVTNILDGVNRTRDDTHMWLAPFTRGANHFIHITFDKPVQIAMMRVWNYNKSRIHSFRGAKDIEVILDGNIIFKGEITRACGGIMGGSEAFGDTILFTTEEDILELVSQYDKTFEADIYMDDDMEEEVERPPTADKGEASMARPFTSAARGPKDSVPHLENVPDIDVSDGPDTIILKGQCLALNFTQTWGDLYYLGLTGLELVGKEGESIPLNINMLEADPRDLHVLPGYENDSRTLEKLVDGVNIITSDDHMWLIPFTEGESHTLTINLPQVTEMSGLRFWNYNKSAEDTFRGAKIVHITLDGRQVSPVQGFLIRKGPGNCFFDFAQEVSFTQPFTPRPSNKESTLKLTQSLIMDEPSQDYEAIQKPCGFIYQLQLLSTWGDPYYVGMNGIEFYDADGNKINLTENNISAYPDSVNVLDGVENDIRTPDKLINGHFDTQDGSHMWLAPILPNILNRVYVIFDQPMEISMIKMWNYSKTANRGVKDFALLVDDLLVYNGTLGMVTQGARGILPNVDMPSPYHTILFTDNRDIRKKEKHTVLSQQTGEQDVQLMNDRQVVATYTNPKMAQSRKPVNQALRPTTSVTGRHNNRRR